MSKNKTWKTTVNFTETDADMIQRLADAKGLALATMIRNMVLNATRQELAQNSQWSGESDRKATT